MRGVPLEKKAQSWSNSYLAASMVINTCDNIIVSVIFYVHIHDFENYYIKKI